jgi:threonylcarbamoyladenosine tRNA methylthiotransferase MtaB
LALARLAAGAEVVVGDIFAHTELMAAPVFEAANERTRPNLKVQDGCDNRCSFCVIPYVRGQSRSLPAERVIAEVRTLVDAGYREVVISGINLGRWGRDLSADSLFVSSPVRETQVGSEVADSEQPTTRRSHPQPFSPQTSLEKLRISSVEPMDWSDELIELVASPRSASPSMRTCRCSREAMPFCAACTASTGPWHYREKILKIHGRPCPTGGHWSRRDGGLSGRDRSRVCRDPAHGRRAALHLPARLHLFERGPEHPPPTRPEQVPVAVSREKANRGVARDSLTAKKAAFLRSLVGRRWWRRSRCKPAARMAQRKR